MVSGNVVAFTPCGIGLQLADSVTADTFSQAVQLLMDLCVQGMLFALDVGPSSVLHSDLIMDGLQDVRTVLESDFGKAVLDVNYFASLPGPAHRKVFLC